MTSLSRKLALLAAGVLAPLLAQAQPAPKIATVDIAKLYDNHWLTQEQNDKLRADENKANEELAAMVKEGQTLVEKYNSLGEQSKSPTLTTEAKAKLQTDAQQVVAEIQQKQMVVNSFRTNTQQSLAQRIESFKNLMLEQIVAAAKKVGQAKGANLLIDKSGQSNIGVPAVLFADDAFDITDEVQKELNKDKPATTTTPAAAGPGSSAPPMLTVPSAGAKK